MAFPGFKIGDAVAFAAANGLQAEASQCQSMVVHPSIRNPHAVRKGCFIDLFERSGLIDDFAAKYWLPLHTEAGARRRQTYLTQKALNERLLAEEPPNGEEAEEEQLQDIDASEVTFGLERDLQLALRGNIDQLEPGLRIADGGKEQVTEAGRIDITAEDQTGAKVLIELKAGVAAPEALTQLLGYMGAVPKQEGQPVRGILVAGDFHPRVVFAVRATTNVQLRRYRFRFTFESVE